MQHGSAVRQGELIDGCKVLRERLTEAGFSEVRIDGLAAANEFVKLRVGRGDPFEDEISSRQTAAQLSDAVHRDLVAEQKMVQHGENHDGVEVPGARAAC